MGLSPAIGSAASGIQRHQAQLDAGARTVAEGGDLVDGTVSSMLALRGVEANAAMLRTADEALGALLDVRA